MDVKQFNVKHLDHLGSGGRILRQTVLKERIDKELGKKSHKSHISNS